MKINKTMLLKSKTWYEKRLEQLEKQEQKKKQLESLKSSTTCLQDKKPLKERLIKQGFSKRSNFITKNNYTNPKKQYYKLVWELTENNNLSALEHHEKRGFYNYHLDHIIPISYGFKKGILPSIIAHIDNLRFIPWKENMKKKAKLPPN